jgi:hypothetical protein
MGKPASFRRTDDGLSTKIYSVFDSKFEINLHGTLIIDSDTPTWGEDIRAKINEEVMNEDGGL